MRTLDDLSSPDRRFAIEISAWEARMSHWIETPRIHDTETGLLVLSCADGNRSLDQASWSSAHVVRLLLRKYPGNHTPPQVCFEVDCLARTATVAGESSVRGRGHRALIVLHPREHQTRHAARGGGGAARGQVAPRGERHGGAKLRRGAVAARVLAGQHGGHVAGQAPLPAAPAPSPGGVAEASVGSGVGPGACEGSAVPSVGPPTQPPASARTAPVAVVSVVQAGGADEQQRCERDEPKTVEAWGHVGIAAAHAARRGHPSQEWTRVIRSEGAMGHRIFTEHCSRAHLCSADEMSQWHRQSRARQRS